MPLTPEQAKKVKAQGVKPGSVTRKHPISRVTRSAVCVPIEFEQLVGVIRETDPDAAGKLNQVMQENTTVQFNPAKSMNVANAISDVCGDIVFHGISAVGPKMMIELELDRLDMLVEGKPLPQRAR